MELSPEAKEARRLYKKAWRKQNSIKMLEYQRDFYERLALEYGLKEQEQEGTQKVQGGK
jgi:hypothetical protein